jgi:hypothetical protein
VEGINLLLIDALTPIDTLEDILISALIDYTQPQLEKTTIKRKRGKPRKYPLNIADINVYLQEEPQPQY